VLLQDGIGGLSLTVVAVVFSGNGVAFGQLDPRFSGTTGTRSLSCW
jgi:hypothetical protein